MGMTRRDSCLLGCGLAGVVALVALLGLARFIRHGADWVQERVARAQAWSNLERTWRAPSAVDLPMAWFPTNVTGFTLDKTGEGVTVAWPPLQGDGWHGRYRKGDQHLDLYVLKVEPGQAGAIQQRLLQAVEDFKPQGQESTTKIKVQVGRFASYQVSPPFHTGALWWHTNYLFLARSEEAMELKEFLWSYLDLVGR